MLSPPSTNLAAYAVSITNGFLPDEHPLLQLTDDYYLPWESVIGQLPQLLDSNTLRTTVDKLPVLSTSHLQTEPEWRRAYLILSFFTHAYIWEAGGPSDHLPPCISIPMLKVAAHLALPPTATYAALNLWNFAPLDHNVSLSNIDNLRTLNTFTGTADESWFYLVSVAIESHGASLISTMLRAIEACSTSNTSLVLSSLTSFTCTVRELGVILKRMNEGCDPLVFYNKIRPFLAGSKNMAVAGLPNGVFYDEGDGKGEWRMFSGGSNAQSSLIQFFDVVLGVEHASKPGTTSKSGFLKEMRAYMPGPHATFLNSLPTPSPIREFCNASPIAELVEAYNLAVKELAAFRDIHIQIVTRYIIRPARMQQGERGGKGLNLAVASNGLEKGLCGTGGTELLPFLKGSRDETKDAALG